MTDYTIKLSTEQSSGSITYVNSSYPPSPTLEVEDFWRIRLKYRRNKIIQKTCGLWRKPHVYKGVPEYEDKYIETWRTYSMELARYMHLGFDEIHYILYS